MYAWEWVSSKCVSNEFKQQANNVMVWTRNTTIIIIIIANNNKNSITKDVHMYNRTLDANKKQHEQLLIIDPKNRYQVIDDEHDLLLW